MEFFQFILLERRPTDDERDFDFFFSSSENIGQLFWKKGSFQKNVIYVNMYHLENILCTTKCF